MKKTKKILLTASASAADGWAVQVRIARISCSFFGTLKGFHCRNIQRVIMTNDEGSVLSAFNFPRSTTHLIEETKRKKKKWINMAEKIWDDNDDDDEKSIYF